MPTFTIDCHVHLYPEFKLRDALEGGLKRLQDLGGDEFGIILVERRDCHFFKSLTSGGIEDIAATNDGNRAVVQLSGGSLTVFPGRQVNSVEGLEILSLFGDALALDRRPAFEMLDGIISLGGVPVINWAPGKWLGKRGVLVREILQRYGAKVAAGDTTLRPSEFAEPKAMRDHPVVIRGSDSLPVPGEERFIGTYGLQLTADSWDGIPARFLERRAQSVGTRPTTMNVGVRLGAFYGRRFFGKRL